MSTWLNFLTIEIKELETLIEPIDEVKEGETVVGIVSDGLKKLWTLSRASKKAADLLEVELKYSPADAQARGRVSEQASKSRAMELLFWIGVLDELEMWGHLEAYGLRIGWQIVEFKQPENVFPFRFLGPGGQM